MSKYKDTSNYGSAIGEAVGASMESALGIVLANLAEEFGYHFLRSGVRKNKDGSKQKKLLMSDNFGNEYDIDGIIANEKMQPLIMLESKYIRYKKHNRDKGSWICTAHSSVRKRYPSIRASVAVLAGSWSGSSLAMLSSFDVIYFLVPFDNICDILSDYGVDFRWDEKDKDQKAKAAWETYQDLSADSQSEIGGKMVDLIKDVFLQRIRDCLDDNTIREISKIILEIVSNYGETKYFEFDCQKDAVDFLENIDSQVAFLLNDDSPTMFDDPIPVEND